MKHSEKKKDSPEQLVLNSVVEYLTLAKVFFWRNNTGAFKGEGGGFYRFGYPGSPDIICVVEGLFVGIECKAKGEVQNENQVKFQKALEAANGTYILAYSVDDVVPVISQIRALFNGLSQARENVKGGMTTLDKS